MTLKELIKKAQGEMGVAADGDWGPVTQAAADGYDIESLKLKRHVVVMKPIESGDYFGAPWIGANIDLLGRHETDPLLNARYVPEWSKEGLPGYKTLAGNTHAWCSVKVNADLRKVGVKGTNSAAAASWSKWGRKCPFWFGSVLDIKHPSGGRHVAFFLYWIDEAKKIAAVYGGNQGNKLSIVSQSINAGGDVCVTGPRWSLDCADGKLVSKADVLKAYPLLKVGGVGGGSTR